MRKAATTLSSAVLLSVVTALPLVAADTACDRACLKTALDRYLQAVTTHDPAGAPLAIGFRQTDNAVAVLPGTGTWTSVTALGSVQRRFFDQVSGQAAYFGTVQEGDNIQNVAARRYPVVDEDAGVVVAMAVFLRKPGSPQRRNVFSELFFLEGRKIRSIYSAMFYSPPEAPVPNWPPYDGNWPLPASFGGTQ
jgi:hypothetical protein